MKRGAGIIVIKDGKTLLVKAVGKSLQLDGTIALPGGHIEPNETEEQAARRELEEETGLIAGTLLEFPGNYIEDELLRKDGLVKYSFRVFVTTDVTGEIRPNDETEPFWIDIEEAKKIQMLQHDNQLLENALKFLNTKN